MFVSLTEGMIFTGPAVALHKRLDSIFVCFLDIYKQEVKDGLVCSTFDAKKRYFCNFACEHMLLL